MNFNTAVEIESRIAEYFDPRRNVIIPNVWWGMGFNHECDLLVLTRSGYAYEVEIKTSRADLKADLKKKNGHYSPKIRKLYFAIPENLKPHIDLIPERAGILMVMQGGKYPGMIEKIREAKPQESAHRFTVEQRIKLAELGTMRIWPLKRAWSELWQRYEDERNPHEWRMEYLG